jgi:DNA modification methylase
MPLFYLRTSSTYWSPPSTTRKRSGRSDSIRSKGFEKDHGFNVRWLREARRVLKPDGTLWVSGTHHIIFSLGFALQSLGFKVILVRCAPLGYHVRPPGRGRQTQNSLYPARIMEITLSQMRGRWQPKG